MTAINQTDNLTAAIKAKPRFVSLDLQGHPADFKRLMQGLNAHPSMYILAPLTICQEGQSLAHQVLQTHLQSVPAGYSAVGIPLYFSAVDHWVYLRLSRTDQGIQAATLIDSFERVEEAVVVWVDRAINPEHIQIPIRILTRGTQLPGFKTSMDWVLQQAMIDLRIDHAITKAEHDISLRAAVANQLRIGLDDQAKPADPSITFTLFKPSADVLSALDPSGVPLELPGSKL